MANCLPFLHVKRRGEFLSLKLVIGDIFGTISCHALRTVFTACNWNVRTFDASRFSRVKCFKKKYLPFNVNLLKRLEGDCIVKGISTSRSWKDDKTSDINGIEVVNYENFEFLQQLREKTGFYKNHNILVIQPNFKWGKNRFHKESVDHMFEEALSLVHSISGWNVIEGRIEPIRKLDPRYFFGKGKLDEITKLVELLQRKYSLTAVFLDCSKLTRRQHLELELLWNVKVLDRYSLVIQIFKERAVTKEAKVLVELAELKYIRSRLMIDDQAHYDQQRGGTYSFSGAGETHIEVARRVLMMRQMKLRQKLDIIRKQRKLIQQERNKRRIPIISVVGYTNAGKTTLIKAFTHDTKMQPENKLFATLDVTAHRCKLPCGMTIILVDTVGFISDLPNELLDSFSATLQDILNSDLILHLRDSSHPEFEAQKSHVLEALKRLKLPTYLMENIVEVNNKIDLRDPLTCNSFIDGKSFNVSAKYEMGLQSLWNAVQEMLFKITGREIMTLSIPQDGLHLSWLHHEATVCHVESTKNGKLNVSIVMDASTIRKYKAKFE